ncbi:2-hydroxyacid dehydrogenase [Ideonella azotifigens]|uniref:2-hydroxyacid dehydrogenase n=2 Tax=Ideonella azotifigens TaxID=513160 RepID=A0ABP3VQ32_9BURK|nr:2-hydroxyacid dehydrogenase [Ideonella azotifigens]MCD2340652.1 2-hydroxyacid dehydrogenase [Ideonella azotifigens]
MTTPRLLLVGNLVPVLNRALAESFAIHRLVEEADPAAFLAAHGGEFEIAVTSAAVGMNEAQLAALPNLKLISSFGVGLDKVPVAAAQARGISVGYTPDVLNDCVADTALALLLDVARRVSEADRFVRAGGWAKGGLNSFGLSRKVSGAKLGVLGMGRIGQAIARRGAGFDMQVRYHTRRPVEGLPWAHESSLLELARWCDYLVVITAGGPSTQHLVNAEVLNALGPRGFVINVARGSVIDEDALVAALRDKRIAGAGLDVFANEPQVPEALLKLDNVVLLPHIASATEETRQAMAQRVLDNIAAFQAGKPLVSEAPRA